MEIWIRYKFDDDTKVADNFINFVELFNEVIKEVREKLIQIFFEDL